MPINYEVYGTPETWHDCYYGGGSAQPWAALVHGEKAKVPTWGLTNPSDTPTFVNSQLRAAVSVNKLTPTAPIDNSICAVGQGRMSPFRKFAVYANHVTTQAPNGEILQIGHAYTGANYNDNETPVNTFWYESNCSSSYGIYGNGAFSRGRLYIKDGATVTQGLDQRIWFPTGVNSHATKKQNGNFYIAPFMSYGARTYVLQIWVYVTNADYDAAYEGNTPTGSWKTLDDWKNNFATKAIIACLLRVRSISSYDSGTGVIGYYGINYGSSDYRKVSCGILDTMKFDLDDGTTLPELTSYGLFSSTSNSDVGVALFNDFANVYKWTDTLQQVTVVPEYISQYIRTNGTSMFPYIPYSDDIYNWIMESCACFGMAFTPAKGRGVDDTNCRFNQAFTDPDLCLPVIDDNGIAHGEYTRGADNVNNDFIDLSSQWDKNYTPSKPVDTNTYSNTTDFRNIDLVSGTNQYILNGLAVTELQTKLYDIFASWADVSYAEVMGKVTKDFLVSEPIQSIVSLYAFPFSPTHSNTTTTVKLGNNDTGITAYTPSKMTEFIEFNGANIFPRFGDCFLDYEPYTRYEVYIPFCGTVKLNAADILGHTLNVKMAVDLVTGVCTGYIMADNLCIETVTGTCGVQLPISGLDTATINANIVSANIRQKSADSSASAALLSTFTPSGLGSAVSNPFSLADKLKQSELSIQQANYDLTHIPANPHSIGAASPLTGWCSDLNARLLIYYPTGDAIDSGNPPTTMPKLNDLTDYAHTTGFATLDVATISNYEGFVQVSTIDLSGIAATDTELSEIRSLLQSGVYV